jgi:hypothetical protein
MESKSKKEKRWRPKALAGWRGPAANLAWSAKRPGTGVWSTVTTAGPRAQRLGGAGAGGSMATEAVQGWRDDRPHGVADPVDKERRAAAHGSGVAAGRRRASFEWRRSVGGGGGRGSTTVWEGSYGTIEEGGA